MGWPLIYESCFPSFLSLVVEFVCVGLAGDFRLIFVVVFLLWVDVLISIFCIGNQFMLRPTEDIYDGLFLIPVPARVEMDTMLG